MKSLKQRLLDESTFEDEPQLSEQDLKGILGVVESWLQDHRKEMMKTVHSNAPDAPQQLLYIPCVTFIDRTLMPSLVDENIGEGKKQ